MNIERFKKKLQIFVNFAESLTSLSTCKRAKCGAIVIMPDFSEILAIGYNGPPRTMPNDSCTGEIGNCGCVHAEANALTKLGNKEGVLISTTHPCPHCAGLIVNSQKILHTMYLNEYRIRHNIILGDTCSTMEEFLLKVSTNCLNFKEK